MKKNKNLPSDGKFGPRSIFNTVYLPLTPTFYVPSFKMYMSNDSKVMICDRIKIFKEIIHNYILLTGHGI